MLFSPKKQSIYYFFFFSIILMTFSFNSFAQCGVYLKQIYTGKFPYSKVHLVRSADMTGDGVADLILSQEPALDSSRRERIFILPNSGNGRFGAPIIFTPPTQTPFSRDILIGKVNNDSLNDLIAFYGSSMAVFLNNGNGTFTRQPVFNAAGFGTPFSFLDINNDGKGDYLGYSSSSVFQYSLGNGDGTFNPPVNFSNSLGVLYPGDINNDGAIDFINTRNLYINNGNLTFTITDVSSYFSFNDIIGDVKDYTGDGKADVLILNLSNSARNFSLLKSTGTVFAKTEYVVSNESDFNGFGTVGNFNSDSSPDVLFNVRYKNKKIVFTNDGAGNFTRQEFAGNFFRYNFHEQIMDDFDNDGKTDSVQITSGTSNSTLLLRDITSLTFQKNICNQPGQPGIVDFDRSGTTDFSFWKPSTGNWSFQTNRDSTLQTETVNWGLGSHGDIPAPGDFDGDGVTDRAVFRNSTGVWYIRRSSDLSWFVFQFGIPGDKPVAADFDGDAISDIAVWRPSDGNWYIWYMGTQQFTAVHFGSDGDKPVPADFDGDLKTDLAVFRPSTGVWYYQKSTDGNIRAIQWGLSNDKPIPADFDGDGNADIVVYRESENNLYILKSYDNSFTGYTWGTSQDKPVIGDFDGDFVADFFVYRPSTKQWWATTPLIGGAVFGDDDVVLTSSILRIE